MFRGPIFGEDIVHWGSTKAGEMNIKSIGVSNILSYYQVILNNTNSFWQVFYEVFYNDGNGVINTEVHAIVSERPIFKMNFPGHVIFLMS